VIGTDGTWLGLIPTPRPIISVAFGGRDKKTLFILARGAEDANGQQIANAAQVYAIQMMAQGYKGRPKSSGVGQATDESAHFAQHVRLIGEEDVVLRVRQLNDACGGDAFLKRVQQCPRLLKITRFPNRARSGITVAEKARVVWQGEHRQNPDADVSIALTGASYVSVALLLDVGLIVAVKITLAVGSGFESMALARSVGDVWVGAFFLAWPIIITNMLARIPKS
jgi:hypothetical protein